jgi:multiple sugar transport system permease protein/N-acetylglucosamine transport system permease protein
VWALVLFNLLIFTFLLVASFRTTAEIFAAPWGLPTTLHVENWVRAWTESGFARATLNTVCLAVAGALTATAVSAPAAYMLSRANTRSAGPLSVFFVVGLGISAHVTVIPLFAMMADIGLVNNLFGLYVLYSATHVPFTVFLLTGFFRSLPAEIEEAAALDGASAWRSFWQIMLPLARSGIITVLILNIISIWNETLLALLNFMSSMQFSGADYGGLFAGVCILVIPMLLLYLWFGRRLVEGITMGSGK